jgi:holliday junction DNA helicase RuvA
VISRLEGVLVERDAPHITVSCGGVGYDVVCSSYTLGQLPSDGERVTLRVFTQVSETKIALYGFFDATERALFDLLITVKNVGPSTAIAILSASAPRDIATLIAREDIGGLTKVKGVGKKTAELLVVELHEKCEMLVLSWNAAGHAVIAMPAVVKPRTRHPMLDEVMGALVGLGWRSAEAEVVVAQLSIEPGVTVEALLRQALRSMPR